MKLLSGFLCAAAVLAASVSQLPAEEATADEEGFISLFNGENLDGWKISENGKWRVEDGKIVANGPRSHLFTEQEFKNFHFVAEVMTTPGSNSGIYFHTKYLDSGWPTHGHEAQVNVTHRDPVKTGSVYGVVKLYETPARDNEWWKQEVIVKGRNIVVKINGKVVVDYTEPEGIEGTRKLSSGSMGLQAHDPDSVVYYRNLKIRPLED
ncbi:MAG: DUF1080 domain-containing protein [Planctomycetaceae bacterium]|nr:DUF1080 domain-containing protein [Planctomycetaceae bacterium]